MATLASKVQSVRNAMTEGVDTGGGFSVETVTEKTQNLIERTGAFRQVARPIQMTSDIHRVPCISTPATFQSPAEAASITATDPTFTRVTLTAQKRSAHTVASGEVLDDTAGLQDAVSEMMAGQLAKAEDQYCWDILEDDISTTVTAANIGAVTLANLASVMASVSAHAGEPVWICSHSVFAELNGLLAATGANEPGRILGADVVLTEGARASTTTTAGQFFACYGFFKSASLFGRRRLNSKVDNESLAMNDQRRLFMHSRFDFLLLNTATTPIAALAVAS